MQIIGMCFSKQGIQAIIVLIACLLATSFVQANTSVAIITSSVNPQYAAVADRITQSAPISVKIDQYSLSDTNFYQLNADLVITIGTDAFREALSSLQNTPILASFLPRRTYAQLTQNEPTKHPRSAVFIDHSMSRQLHLARLLAPQAKRVGSVFGSSSIEERLLLLLAAERWGFQIVSQQLTPSENAVGKLQATIQDSDLFLALPDQSAFNRATAKWALFISLKNKTPLIGFSEKYVEAGALAAVVSTPEQIGQQTAEALAFYLRSGALPVPAHPHYFSVAVNPSSASTLRTPLPDARTLEKALKDTE